MEEITNRTVEIINKRYKTARHFKKFKKIGIPLDAMKMASNLLNLHNFWSQPESRGLITKRLINEFTIDLTSHPTDSKRAHIWAKYTMDCYLSAFYEIIWLNRNEHTFNTIIGEDILK